MQMEFGAPPYKIIADCFKNRSLVPFVGSATSYVGMKSGSPLPSASQLALELLGDQPLPGIRTDDLAQVSQYIEEIQADRPYLLQQISSRFFKGLQSDYSTAFTEFLAIMPGSMIPRLIITTNYDVLVERVLEARGIPYIALSSIKTFKYAGRWICYESVSEPLRLDHIKTFTEVEQLLLDSDEAGSNGPIVIYKLHGTAKLEIGEHTLDSIVLTENDYVEFLANDTLKKIPAQLLSRLRVSRLLFLGYSLKDWNLRVLLRQIRMLQQQNSEDQRRHWAFQKDPEVVEAAFWRERGVNVYNVSLDICLNELQRLAR